MLDKQPNMLLKQVRTLVSAQVFRELPDCELLDIFRDAHDEGAFAALMKRHGAMVFGVCRRILGNRHDAEDACQASFLVLARKADSVRSRDSLGSWLHGVAFRVASDLKKRRDRHRSRERAETDAPGGDTVGEVTWREAQSILDEELNRLPARYRAPLVLCYLQGKTRDEAARELGWGLGAFRGLLDRGRILLRQRLTRRGITLTAVLFGTALDECGLAASLAPTLAITTARAAVQIASGKSVIASAISANVGSLTEGVLQAMFLTKLKTSLGAILTLGILGFLLWACRDLEAKADEATESEPVAFQVATPKTDQQKIQGAWVGVSVEAEDDDRLAEVPELLHMTFREDKVQFTHFGGGGMTGTFRLDATRDPKTIDLVNADGGTARGIYELRGNRLTMCIDERDGARPTEFKPRDKQILIVFEMHGKSTKAAAAEKAKHLKKLGRLYKQMRDFQVRAEILQGQLTVAKSRLETRDRYLECELKKVDIEKNAIDLVLRGTTLKIERVPIATDAKFFLGEKECAINELRPGMSADLSMETREGRSEVVEIKALAGLKKE